MHWTHLVKFVSSSPRFQPFGHDVHLVLLNPYRPTPQSVHEAEPVCLVNVPRSHWMHLVKSVSVSPRFQPFGHESHVVLLDPNLPTPHSEHNAASSPLVKNPIGQSVHAVAPDPENSRLSHGVHTLLFVAPDTLLLFPGGHALHVAEEAAPIAVE